MCAKNIYVCTTLLLLVRTTYICATYHIHMWREQAITEWSWWVTSNDACEPGEQLIVLANGDDESDLVGWSLLLLAATVRSSAHMPARDFRSQQYERLQRTLPTILQVQLERRDEHWFSLMMYWTVIFSKIIGKVCWKKHVVISVGRMR